MSASTSGATSEEYAALRQQIAQLEAERDAALAGLAARDAQEHDKLTQIDTIPQPIVIHRGGKVLYVNRATAELARMPDPASLVGRSIFDFVHPDYRTEVLERARATGLRGEAVPRFEQRLLRADGTTVEVESIAIPVTIDGEPATQVFMRDISVRKRAEAHLRFLVEASGVLSASLDLATTLQLLARLCAPDLADCCVVELSENDGLPRQVAIATTTPKEHAYIQAILTQFPSLWQMNRPAAQPLLAGIPRLICPIDDDVLAAIFTDHEHRMRMKQLNPHAAIIVPLNPRGQVIGALTLLSTHSKRDYTRSDLNLAEDLARRAAVAADNARLFQQAQQATAREQEVRLRAERAERHQSFLAKAHVLLAESIEYDERLNNLSHLLIPDFALYCIFDLVEEDQTIRRITNTHADPALQPLLRQLQDQFPPTWDSDVPGTHALLTGEPQLFIRTSNKSTVSPDHADLLVRLGSHDALAVPMLARGRTIGAITLARGINYPPFSEEDCILAAELAARAAMAIDNARLYREAREALSARDRFLSVASHELKTPLTTLLGNAQLLERQIHKRPDSDSRDRRAIELIIGQTRRLSRMVATLLDISRSESEQLQIEPEPLDLVALTSRIVNELQIVSDHHTLQFHTTVAHLMITGDPMRLEQVLQNLIQNAVKYSPNGGPVEITIEVTGEIARIAITDHGIGIPAQALPLLFRRFYRAANSEQWRITGMGIGLFVVRQIVDLHGGEVHVQSTEGEGSTFTVTLPGEGLGTQPSKKDPTGVQGHSPREKPPF